MSPIASMKSPSAGNLSDAALNALPHPVLVVERDNRIVDANIAAESFFEMSTPVLRRQSLPELVPFGSPLIALIALIAAVACVACAAPTSCSSHCLGAPVA